VKKSLLFCLFAIAVPLSAREPLTMRLTPRMALEPAALTVRTVVETDAGNRLLQIVAQSADFYRSSYVELDGASAPRLNVFEFKNLPYGTYEVSSVLVGVDGRRAVVSREFRVSPGPGSPR
jgi:hypothetical protein